MNKKLMKIAIVGDSFTDKYVMGEVDRLSPEAPIPILDVSKTEIRFGGALNVAANLKGLGLEPVVFTITNLIAPFEIISPSDCTPLEKTRFVTGQYQLLRVDQPKVYRRHDLERAIYPKKNEFDIVAFIDYDKGIVKEGEATLVDSKKRDLSVFRGSKYLKINEKEYRMAVNVDLFPEAFITRGKEGIDFFRYGKFIQNEPAQVKEVIDVSGAGDTVAAVIIYCLANGISDPIEIMRLANKAAGIKVSKFGTAIVTYQELFKP